jgi:hypothetical protein
MVTKTKAKGAERSSAKRKPKRKGAYKGRTPGSKNKVQRDAMVVRSIRLGAEHEHALSMLNTYSVLKGLRFQDCLQQAVDEYLEARRANVNVRGRKRTPEERKLLEFMGRKGK